MPLIFLVYFFYYLQATRYLQRLYERHTACTVSACLLLKEVDQPIGLSFVLEIWLL